MLDLLQRFHRAQPGQDEVQSHLQTGTDTHTHTHTQIPSQQLTKFANLLYTHYKSSLLFTHQRKARRKRRMQTVHKHTQTHTHTPVGWVLMYVWPCVCIHSVSTETWQLGTFSCRRATSWRSVTSAWPETYTKTPTTSGKATYGVPTLALLLLSISIHCGETLLPFPHVLMFKGAGVTSVYVTLV